MTDEGVTHAGNDSGRRQLDRRPAQADRAQPAPSCQVICLDTSSAALHEWQLRPADMVITDWNLPDGPGTACWSRCARTTAARPLVVITGRSDRASVLEVRVEDQRLYQQALPGRACCRQPGEPCCRQTRRAPLQPATRKDDLLAHLHSLPSSELQLPLKAQVRDRLCRSFKGEPSWICASWPANGNRPRAQCPLLSVANSSAYNQAKYACSNLLEALQNWARQQPQPGHGPGPAPIQRTGKPEC